MLQARLVDVGRRLLAALLLCVGLSAIEPASAVPAPDPVPVPSDPSDQPSGYRLVASDGGVFAFGGAGFRGSLGGLTLQAPVVGMAVTPSGAGYWLVSADGGVFAFGDAGFFGSLGGLPLQRPVVGISATPSGRGYWLAAADGGVFALGDAPFAGSVAGTPLNAPVVSIRGTRTGAGYWLAGQDGGVFAWGDAPFLGSLSGGAGVHVTSMLSIFGTGYHLVEADGVVHAFPGAHTITKCQPQGTLAPVVGLAYEWHLDGLWVATAAGEIVVCDSENFGTNVVVRPAAPIVGVTAGYEVR